MKLYVAAASPFVRKVLVLLHETGNLDRVEQVDVHTTPVAPNADVAASNPLAKIPVLERSDGPALYDSRVICAYLDEVLETGLYAAGWDSRIMEATADGIMDAAILMTYERRLRSPEQQSEAWIEAQRAKVLGGCAGLNARWMSHLQGPLDMGQIAVACALAYLDFRHPDIGWRDGNLALADWFEQFSNRDSMISTKPS